MAVISVCLALARVHLETGLLVSFLTVPALIRTAIVATREAQTGAPISAAGKILEFLFSWMLMLPIGLAALIVGGIALLAVFLMGYMAVDIYIRYFGSLLPRQCESVLVTHCLAVAFTATVGSAGLVLAWGIRSSLAYRPVARI
jgi:mannitol-specific phosphotransferase system IIBC component